MYEGITGCTGFMEIISCWREAWRSCSGFTLSYNNIIENFVVKVSMHLVVAKDTLFS